MTMKFVNHDKIFKLVAMFTVLGDLLDKAGQLVHAHQRLLKGWMDSGCFVNAGNELIKGNEPRKSGSFARRKFTNLLSQPKRHSLEEGGQERVLLNSHHGLQAGDIVARQVSKKNNLVLRSRHIGGGKR